MVELVARFPAIPETTKELAHRPNQYVAKCFLVAMLKLLGPPPAQPASDEGEKGKEKAARPLVIAVQAVPNVQADHDSGEGEDSGRDNGDPQAHLALGKAADPLGFEFVEPRRNLAIKDFGKALLKGFALCKPCRHLHVTLS